MGKEDKKKYDPLMAQLQPLINTQREISMKTSEQGMANIDSAKKDYDYVSSYLKTLFEGKDDELLKILNSSEITAGLDENFQQAGELGVRGGARSAVLGNATFAKDAALNKVLAMLRNAAPDKIAQIAQGIGNLGLGEFGASTSSANFISSNLMGVQEMKNQDADRRAALIGSIFSSLGGVAGAALGAYCIAIGDSFINTPAAKDKLGIILYL